ncbi:MAG: hypothetical protein JSS60_08390 [Verrucomicrobia bacterium]|nr:hypothetical protein [Verrucomicrobiota bacterium]
MSLFFSPELTYAALYSKPSSAVKVPPKENEDLKRILPERLWKAPDQGKLPLDLTGRTKALAQKRCTAAKGALDTHLLVLGDQKLTIKEVLLQFKQFREGLLLSLQSGKPLRVGKDENGVEVELSYEEVHKIFVSKEFAAVCKLSYICEDLVKELDGLDVDEMDHQKMQAFRQRLNEILQSDPYLDAKAAKSERNDYFVHFLQSLSFEINTHAEGMEELEKIGEGAIEQYCILPVNENEEINAKTLSEWTETIFSGLEADKWDSTLAYIMWALKNIHKALMAFIDSKIPYGNKLYNSYELGNANMWIGDFEVNGAKIRFNLGPSPTSDSLFEAQLEWEQSQGMEHIQHTLEHNHPAGETARLEQMRDLAEAQRMKVIGSPMDGPIAKGEGQFSHVRSVEEFHKKLSTEVCGRTEIPLKIEEYNGFANSILTDDEIQEAITASQEAFGTILGPQHFTNTTDRQNERVCKAMLLGFTGFLVVKTLLKLGDQLKGKSQEEVVGMVMATMGQACKQDVDRGPVVNAVTIAFIQMINNGSLKGKDAKQLIGLVVMRALMVDGRQMIKGRLEAFLDLFNLIGQNQKGFVEKLQKFVGKEEETPSPIRFIPANTQEALPKVD